MTSRQHRRFLDTIYNYEECVDLCAQDFEVITIESDFIERLAGWIDNMVEAKQDEAHHKADGNKERKRWMTGYLGEYAVEQYLGQKFIDWSIGDSGHYHRPDMSSIGIDCGIKTVEYGKFPLIFKNSHDPEFIVIRKSYDTFWLCGYADPSVLNIYQSDDLILDDALRKRGTKTAFYGFEHLIAPLFLKLLTWGWDRIE